jgi:hypothetical protein
VLEDCARSEFVRAVRQTSNALEHDNEDVEGRIVWVHDWLRFSSAYAEGSKKNVP